MLSVQKTIFERRVPLAKFAEKGSCAWREVSAVWQMAIGGERPKFPPFSSGRRPNISSTRLTLPCRLLRISKDSPVSPLRDGVNDVLDLRILSGFYRSLRLSSGGRRAVMPGQVFSLSAPCDRLSFLSQDFFRVS